MTGIAYHTPNTPGAMLQKLAQEIFDNDPRGRDLQWAMARARERRADLAALHHAGLAEAPEPTVDPGVLLSEKAHQLQKSGAARSFVEAVERAHRALPEAAKAYQAGQMLLADRVPGKHQAEAPPRRNADPALELLRLTQERLATDATLTVEQAQRAVLAADPMLARHYNEARPLPMTAAPSASEKAVEEQLVRMRAMQAELDGLAKLFAPATQRPHYSQLPPAEQRRLLPERKLANADAALQPGETPVHRLTAGSAGGFYAVREPAHA